MEAVRSYCVLRRWMAIEKVEKVIRYPARLLRWWNTVLKYGYLSVSMATSLDWIFTTSFARALGMLNYVGVNYGHVSLT